MEALLKYFGQLGELIPNIVDFLLGIVEDLIYIVKILGDLVLRLPEVVGWLPSTCISLVVTTFAIVLVYRIIGRD